MTDHAIRGIAITRAVGTELAACELSFVDRAPIDVALAGRQHEAYCAALAALGCDVVELAPLPGHPDAVFVEDTAVVVPELAVITRPGAISRRGETASIRQALALHRAVADIEAPGTLDGGDVLRVGRRVFVGVSARSNASGIDQLRHLLAPHGYTVEAVATRECLHLKSAVTEVADGLLLVNADWVDLAPFAAFARIAVDPSEPHAANALKIGDGLVFPQGFPRTQARLVAEGLAPTVVDLSELQKAEGATTCCSIVLHPA